MMDALSEPLTWVAEQHAVTCAGNGDKEWLFCNIYSTKGHDQVIHDVQNLPLFFAWTGLVEGRTEEPITALTLLCAISIIIYSPLNEMGLQNIFTPLNLA
jgi:deoxyxylulose-5-phosphate synthase